MIDSYLDFCFKWEVYTSLDGAYNLECGALYFFLLTEVLTFWIKGNSLYFGFAIRELPTGLS